MNLNGYTPNTFTSTFNGSPEEAPGTTPEAEATARSGCVNQPCARNDYVGLRADSNCARVILLYPFIPCDFACFHSSDITVVFFGRAGASGLGSSALGSGAGSGTSDLGSALTRS